MNHVILLSICLYIIIIIMGIMGIILGIIIGIGMLWFVWRHKSNQFGGGRGGLICRPAVCLLCLGARQIGGHQLARLMAGHQSICVRPLAGHCCASCTGSPDLPGRTEGYAKAMKRTLVGRAWAPLTRLPHVRASGRAPSCWCHSRLDINRPNTFTN